MTDLPSLPHPAHAILRDDFAVSCEALGTRVAIARRQHGRLGARRTGAGFGGCAVALVERPRAQHDALAPA